MKYDMLLSKVLEHFFDFRGSIEEASIFLTDILFKNYSDRIEIQLFLYNGEIEDGVNEL